jgi:hypothetical protein
MAAKEMGQLSLIDALALVACYARTGSPKFDRAAVRWLALLGEERNASLRGHSVSSECARGVEAEAPRLGREDALRFLG